MFTAIRSSRKSAAVATVNSEASAAVDAMVQMIKFSEHATCSSPTVLDLVRANQDDLRYILQSGQIASVSGVRTSFLTSTNLNVLSSGCGDMFSCTNNGRTVEICFDAVVSTGFDTSDNAGANTGEVRFQTEVTLRNFGN